MKFTTRKVLTMLLICCFAVSALAAGKNTVLLEKQAREFKPEIVAVASL